MLNASGPDRPAEKDRFNPNIHGARGAFALSVFVFHIANSGLKGVSVPCADLIYEAAMSLAFGVELFFVISGIVILGAFQRARSLPGFLIDRVTRIFPVLWASVLVVYALWILSGRTFGSGLESAVIVVANLFALPPIVRVPLIHPAAWSLSYEFAFYLLFVAFGLLALVVPRRIALLVVFALAVAVFWYHVRATYFIVGLAIGSGFLAHRSLRPLIRYPLFWLVVFMAAWQGVAILVGGNIHAAIWSRLASEPLLLVLSLVALVAASLAMGGIDEGLGWTSRALRHPVMQWLGTISFSLYLWQTPVLGVVKQAMSSTGIVTGSGEWAQIVLFLLALPPTLIVSALSQRYLEIGVTNWLRRHLIPRKHGSHHRTIGADTSLVPLPSAQEKP